MREKLLQAVSNNLDWIETMHTSKGYCGPVTHYWRLCFDYVGPGFDWRYEGLISGFLNLFEKTHNPEFLRKAIRSGKEILKAQLPSGCYIHSAFESNPRICGGASIHEAAVDISLLNLSKVLKKMGDSRWNIFYEAAERNLKAFHLKRLWDKKRRTFTNSPNQKVYVPNKIATISEALLLLGEMSGTEKYLKKYVIPSVDFILTQQVKDKDSEIYGGIYQEEQKGEHRHVMTFYNARCVPVLTKIYELTGDKNYLNSAKLIGRFIKRMELREGGFSQEFLNEGGKWKLYKYPIWVAGAGDIVRALKILNNYGLNFNLRKNLEWILNGMDRNGGIRTSYGLCFRRKNVNQMKNSYNDVLHVVGWNDKSFRIFTEMLHDDIELPESQNKTEITVKCFDGVYIEDKKNIYINSKKFKFKFCKESPHSPLLESQILKLGEMLVRNTNSIHNIFYRYEHYFWRFLKRLFFERRYEKF